MVPFVVRQKQEIRNIPEATHVRHIEIQISSNKYRLLPFNYNKNVQEYTVNGKLYSGTSYRDSLVDISIVLNWKLGFKTKFGLDIIWDGQEKPEVSVCNSYKGYLCGLCGNADGVNTNDFVDRNNNPIDVTTGDHFTKYYTWGQKWLTYDDTAGVPA